jgi:hypothetical protein
LQRFVNAEIGNLPLPDALVDVVISNGVFNLCPHKKVPGDKGPGSAGLLNDSAGGWSVSARCPGFTPP